MTKLAPLPAQCYKNCLNAVKKFLLITVFFAEGSLNYSRRFISSPFEVTRFKKDQSAQLVDALTEHLPGWQKATGFC